MTADPATLRALAQRARDASGPDRMLDADVADAIGFDPTCLHAPPYTASIDAVIRDVVPAECGWSVTLSQAERSKPAQDALAHVNPPLGSSLWKSFCLDGCATPALALLAASLLARAALAEATP